MQISKLRLPDRTQLLETLRKGRELHRKFIHEAKAQCLSDETIYEPEELTSEKREGSPAELSEDNRLLQLTPYSSQIVISSYLRAFSEI